MLSVSFYFGKIAYSIFVTVSFLGKIRKKNEFGNEIGSVCVVKIYDFYIFMKI